MERREDTYNRNDGRRYGHDAEKPRQIPKKGWKQIFTRVKDQVQEDHIPIISAGIAFYMFLSIFPAIAALLSIYGLIMDPQQVQQQISQLSSIMPEQAQQFLGNILENTANKSQQSLGWGVALSILLSLWSANKATKALFEGVGIAYDEKSERGFFKENGISLLFTLGGIIVAIICLSFIVAFPALVGNLGLPGPVQTIIEWSRWLVLGLIVVFAISAVYKVAPDRRSPQFKWVSWGAVFATVLWLVGSWLFSYYVKNFGSFDQTYGPVAAIVILMLWFFLTSILILIGAEINSEMEYQTEKDTTVGKRRPMGQREAYQADHSVVREYEKREFDRREAERRERERKRY